jgi:uncharacterized protein (DUF2164 family)
MPYVKLPKNVLGKKIINYININRKEYRLVIKECKISQIHKDILNAVILNAIQIGIGKNGNIAVLFSQRQVLKTLGHNNLSNHAWLQKKLDEMQSSLFLISDADNNYGITFSILLASGYSKETIKEVDGGFGKNSYYYFIEFNPYYLRFADIDVALFLKNKKILEKIIKIKSGILKALIWYCLSQNRLNKDLIEILNELNIVNNGITKREKNIIIKKIKDSKDYLKKEFGIEIKKMLNGKYGVFYHKLKDVWFEKGISSMPKLIEKEAV